VVGAEVAPSQLSEAARAGDGRGEFPVLDVGRGNGKIAMVTIMELLNVLMLVSTSRGNGPFAVLGGSMKILGGAGAGID
jgi:hypothetical protein